MAPSGPALHHPAAPLLLELATLGCTSEMGDTWMQELIEAAIKKGAHPSAMDPEAAKQLRDKIWRKSTKATPAWCTGTTSRTTRHQT